MAEVYMSRGRGSLSDLIAELDRQAATKVDFVADARQFNVEWGGEAPRPARADLSLVATTETAREWLPGPMRFTRNGIRQFLAKSQPAIPFQLYQKLPRDAETSAYLGHLFRNSGKRRLFRCLDDRVRAVQSDAYKMIDHIDLAFHALDTVKSVNGSVIDCRLTDSEMRIAFTTNEVAGRIIAGQSDDGEGLGWQADHTFRKITGLQWGGYEPPFGNETVHPCISLRNSETGEGGLHVDLGILESACLNMCLVQREVAKVHIGQRMNEGMYAADTREQMSRTILMQVRDVLRRAFNPEWFNNLCATMNETAATPIENPTSAVMNFAVVNKMADSHRDKVLQHFLSNNAYNVFQLGRAISRSAQEVDADEATMLEQLAGETMMNPYVAQKCDRPETIKK